MPAFELSKVTGRVLMLPSHGDSQHLFKLVEEVQKSLDSVYFGILLILRSLWCSTGTMVALLAFGALCQILRWKNL